MCFVGTSSPRLDVDTATGNLYFTSGKKVKRFTKNDNTQKNILTAIKSIFAIAIDTLNR